MVAGLAWPGCTNASQILNRIGIEVVLVHVERIGEEGGCGSRTRIGSEEEGDGPNPKPRIYAAALFGIWPPPKQLGPSSAAALNNLRRRAALLRINDVAPHCMLLIYHDARRCAAPLWIFTHHESHFSCNTTRHVPDASAHRCRRPPQLSAVYHRGSILAQALSAFPYRSSLCCSEA
ncbi:hypothetical protein U9M48_030431 [Paspalum notatum var. saurae]|uniref:Uncharacterized protein n=1 Tax=Paspalum notatum var. saurae TaxID=547442 RepID=A0AAQ3U092_PASNO